MRYANTVASLSGLVMLPPGMPREKKHAVVNFRTQPALKESFDEWFSKQRAYSSATAFYEDCMRGLIASARSGQEIEPPLQFVTKVIVALDQASVTEPKRRA